MDNITNFNETLRPSIWIADIATSCSLVLISLYLLIVLLYYQIIAEKPRKTRFSRLTIEKKYGVLSKYTCILIAFASLFRHFSYILLLSMEGSAVLSNTSMQQTYATKILCQVLPRIANILLCTGGAMVYLFLWFRQGVFYVHSSLKVLNSKFVQVFSFAVFILYVFFCVALLIAYLSTIRYHLNEAGLCLFEPGSDNAYTVIISSWISVSILMQIALLGLFIYPILERTLWRENQQDQRNTRLMSRVKKAVCLACICLGTDVFSGVALYVLHKENANNPIFLFSLNMVINHLVTIACFDYWRKLLWPWSIKCRKRTSPTSATANDFLSGSASLTQHQNVAMTSVKTFISKSGPRSSSKPRCKASDYTEYLSSSLSSSFGN